jgi:RNA polymerase sigma-70 factor (ECF subfamily)
LADGDPLPAPSTRSPFRRFRWFLRVPAGAFWLFEGSLATLLVVAILFARREDVTVDAILFSLPRNSAGSGAVPQEERAVQAMHAVHELLWPRLKSLEASGVGNDFWFRSTYSHLMAPTGHCGSFAQVLARTLQRDGFEVKVGQMRVGETWGGHIIVLAKAGDRWIALDPYFDVAFRGPDGRVLGPDEIRSRWDEVRSQCPVNYDPSYRYESIRYTNWRGIPLDVLGAFFGQISLRTHLLNLYWLFAFVAAAGLVVSVPLHVLHRRAVRSPQAKDRSIQAVFDEIVSEMRTLSALYMKAHPAEVTVQPTVIVGEAFARLAKHNPEDFKDENEFRVAASAVLRGVFAERARKRIEQQKQAVGENARAVQSRADIEVLEFQGASPELFLALESALKALAGTDPRAARVAELRIFGSLPTSAVATVVGSSQEAVAKDWTFAKSFMQRYIRDQGTRA